MCYFAFHRVCLFSARCLCLWKVIQLFPQHTRCNSSSDFSPLEWSFFIHPTWQGRQNFALKDRPFWLVPNRMGQSGFVLNWSWIFLWIRVYTVLELLDCLGKTRFHWIDILKTVQRFLTNYPVSYYLWWQAWKMIYLLLNVLWLDQRLLYDFWLI